MVLNEVTLVIVLCFSIFACLSHQFAGQTQDQTSTRPNTLFDDPDDLQPQLDNEARDRLKFGQPKTIWVLHFPTPFPQMNDIEKSRRFKSALVKRQEETTEVATYITTALVSSSEWSYNRQAEWGKLYPDCIGRSQSPVNLPLDGFTGASGTRQLRFLNYDIAPDKMSLVRSGKRLALYGEWNNKAKPIVNGGAAHSRRYIFHSLHFFWPSEHTIGGLNFPIETQAIHISAEYNSMQEALTAARGDPEAFLGIVNVYKFDNHTHQGFKELLNAAKSNTSNSSLTVHPLSFFVPPFKEYACYHGSLTSPPCTESVLWLVRSRSLPVTREDSQIADDLLGPDGETIRFAIRAPQPLNDRKIYLFP